EAAEHGPRPFSRDERYDGVAGQTVDDGHRRTLLADNGDGFAKEVDVLRVSSGGDLYGVTVQGGVDACLNGGLVCWHSNHIGGEPPARGAENHGAEKEDTRQPESRTHNASEAYRPKVGPLISSLSGGPGRRSIVLRGMRGVYV